jgi:hypothetical protein
MMKRFGRNQKRKLKAELIRSQAVCQTYERHLVKSQKEAVGLRSKLAGIYDVLISDFNKFHPVQQVLVSDESALGRDLKVIHQFALDGDYYKSILHLIKLDVWPDEYKRSVGIRVQYKDQSVGYHLSDYELTNSVYTLDEMAKKIAKELDAHMRSQLSK